MSPPRPHPIALHDPYRQRRAETRPGQESHSGSHKHQSRASSARRRPSRATGPLQPRRLAGRNAICCPPTSMTKPTPRFLTTPKSSAYIKIAEGCDHPCTFCVIPNLRGKFRSRRFESVVAEAQQLVARGVQRNHAHRPGHHLLRRRSRPEGRPRHTARRACRHRGPALAALPLRLSQPHHRPAARNHRPPRQHLQISRPAAAARLARCPQSA